MYRIECDELYEALTGYVCNTYADIAAVTGWVDTSKVMNVLAYVRQPDVAKALGWTVPYVSRAADHTYHVVEHGSPDRLDPGAADDIGLGALSVTRLMATFGEREAHALREAAALMASPAKAKRWRQACTVLEGAAASLAILADDMATNGV